jgi:hypothetical protein
MSQNILILYRLSVAPLTPSAAALVKKAGQVAPCSSISRIQGRAANYPDLADATGFSHVPPGHTAL